MVGGSAKDDEGPSADGQPAWHSEPSELGASSTLRARQDGDADADADFEALLRDVAAVDAPLPVPGQVIAGKYRIDAQLGRGGMGAVYRASHLVSGKQVAIKWMLPAGASEQARQRFLREAKIAARVDHPNVVDVYDIGQDRDTGLYLVMQLLRGESLRAHIARGQSSIAETLDLLVPAMRGVAAIHEAGVVHRDLKPDNIFLCDARAGSARIAKVLDFGISAMTGPERSDPTLTGEGAAIGTPAYMSPEQLSDSRKVDARCDVYAFGVILFEALTGALPFTADSHNGLVVAIATSAPPDPRALRADLPEPLANVILHALAKRREDRIPDVTALIEALEPFATRQSAFDGAQGARASTPAQSERKGARWGRVGLLLGLAILLGGGGGYWWWQRAELAQRVVPAAAESTSPAALPAALVPAQPAKAAAQPETDARESGSSATPAQADSGRARETGTRPAKKSATGPGPATPASPAAPNVLPASATETASPTPPEEQAPPPTRNAKGRSGKISVDDL